MIKFLDCTLRDGGYYNDWDFHLPLINDYLLAMDAIEVDYVEIGFRSLKNQGFKGGCAFSTDNFIQTLAIPVGLRDKIGVMINGAELVNEKNEIETVLEKLFTSASKSPVSLVRIASHIHEFEKVLPAAIWLKKQGYKVGFNLMQIADRSESEIRSLAKQAENYPIDVLYFADSLGSLTPKKTVKVIKTFKEHYSGELGIHAHDNMGLALANSSTAIEEGATWVDSTVTGIGRGPGNVKTEYLVIELAELRDKKSSIVKLLETVHRHFKPMQEHYGWGSNPYYYLAGKYGIHPSYVQEMCGDSRYNEEDILAVIDHLKSEGGKKFDLGALESARHFYSGITRGSWEPMQDIKGRDVLILGAGPSVSNHKAAIEDYIKFNRPYVISLNTIKNIDEDLISIRAACHPVRLLADCHEHLKLKQPLATPASMLPTSVRDELKDKCLLDFGLSIKLDTFEFHTTYCTLPTSLVVAYALAIASSGEAHRILLAGFDGYDAGDKRRHEADAVFQTYLCADKALPLLSVTPTLYEIPSVSIYALNK